MHLLVIIAGVIFLFIWLSLTFARGSFWLVSEFRQTGPTPESWPRVIAIVPARNEAETIARTVAALAQQDYGGEFSILVVDDHSEDNTAALAAREDAHRRIKVLSAASLPAGWTGKLWALEQGVDAAEEHTPDFYWFTDADVVHAPETLRRLVSHAEQGALDLASLMVLLQANSVPERVLIPAFLYFFLKLYPPKWIADSRSKKAGAAGGCILLRRDALNRIGGLQHIRGEIIDDCALARAVKSCGGKIWMGLTRSSVSLRSYGTFSEIRDMIARTAFTQLRYSPVILMGTVLGLFFTYISPVLLVFARFPPARLLGLAAWLLMTITFLPTIRFYRRSVLLAPLLPVAALFYTYATILSAVRYWLGRGAQWKGRAQAPRAA